MRTIRKGFRRVALAIALIFALPGVVALVAAASVNFGWKDAISIDMHDLAFGGGSALAWAGAFYALARAFGAGLGDNSGPGPISEVQVNQRL